jgi:hypothetical protein
MPDHDMMFLLAKYNVSSSAVSTLIPGEGDMAIAGAAGPLMNRGLAAAFGIIVVRIGLELLGAPESVNNIFGVAWLYFIMPVLFARRIAARADEHPFRALFQSVFLFALYTRLMVLCTYMLAYLFQWQAPRFSARMGGNVGGNTGPFMGLVVIPVRNAGLWIFFATVIGLIIGGIILALKKRSPAAQPPKA